MASEEKGIAIHFEYAAELDDTAELNSMAVDAKGLKAFYAQFPNETLEGFNKIARFSREMNTSVQSPEVVIMGKQGQGKSMLLEAILGHPIVPIRGTKRPIQINILCNLECESPRVTIKRDPLYKDTDDVVVPFNNLVNEIAQRNSVVKDLSNVPIMLKYECKHLGNLTLIDTPGLRFDVSTPDKEEREKIVLELAKAPQRVLLCVEESNEWENIEMIEFAKKIDIKLNRTVFALTKFQQHLIKFNNPNTLSNFFAKKPSEGKFFFVSLVSKQHRDNAVKTIEDSTPYITKFYQAWARDNATMDNIKFDKRRYEAMLGLNSLRSYLLELSWRAYKDVVPEIRKQIAALKKTAENNLQKIQELYSGLDSYRLRSIISNYVADWLQVVVQLIDGSTEGNPSISGQTLEEEDALGGGQWLDINDTQVEPLSLGVKSADNKLYGGHQMERMLNVFKAIVQKSNAANFEPEDIEVASTVTFPIGKSQTTYSASVIATHLAHRRCEALFVPLIHQVATRATYIMKRLPDVAFQVLDTRSRNTRITSRTMGGYEITSLKGYTYFQSICRDLFNDFISKTGILCLEKLMDEITCSEFTYWELNTDTVKEAETQESEEKRVQSLAAHLYAQIRDSLIQNVLLKAHNYFLVVMPRDISGEILKQVSTFSDKAMEEMFDVEQTRKQLQGEEDKEKEAIQSFQQKENDLREQTSLFARFKLN